VWVRINPGIVAIRCKPVINFTSAYTMVVYGRNVPATMIRKIKLRYLNLNFEKMYPKIEPSNTESNTAPMVNIRLLIIGLPSTFKACEYALDVGLLGGSSGFELSTSVSFFNDVMKATQIGRRKAIAKRIRTK
jgi:hypothetical protein